MKKLFNALAIIIKYDNIHSSFFEVFIKKSKNISLHHQKILSKISLFYLFDWFYRYKKFVYILQENNKISEKKLFE